MIGSHVGNIRVTGTIGYGGMGEVYAGWDEKLHRDVALKTIRHERAMDPALRARFLQEARILSRLRHPGICQIYDYVEGRESDVLVLELVEGRDLRVALDSGIDRAAALRIATELAEVLVAAHAEGIVHRDLKPANIMLGSSGRIKVLDFGLARSLAPAQRGGATPPGVPARLPEMPTKIEEAAARTDDATATRTRVPAAVPAADHEVAALGVLAATDGAVASVATGTQVGTILGSPQYMSPEQARGEPATPASDMYSFALVLQHLLTGRVPYATGMSLETLVEHAASGETLAFGDRDRDLAALVARLKSPAPPARPTALETAQRLRWIRDRPARRLRRIAAATAAMLVLAATAKYMIDLQRERAVAVEARNEADDLVSFMLDDLYESLRPVGRLDLLDKVAHKALAQYGDLTGENLERGEGRPALALMRIGQVLEDRGDWQGALSAHTRSLAAFESLAARSPRDERARYRVGLAHLATARVQSYLGRFPESSTSFERALGVARTLSTSNEEHRLFLVNIYVEQANAQWRSGQLARALQNAEAALQLAPRVVPGGTAGRSWLVLLANAQSQACHINRELRRVDRELAACSEAVARSEEIVSVDRKDAMAQAQLSTRLMWQANAFKESGDLHQALATQVRALRLSEALVKRDPDNGEWLNNLSMCQVRHGELLQLDGQAAESRAALETAARLIEPLARGDSALYVLDTQALALLMLGDVERARPVVARLLAHGWKKKEFLFWAGKRGLLPVEAASAR